MSKALQASKIAEIRETLVASGFATIREQTHALGLGRSTTWSVLQATHKHSGLSPGVINRMLDCAQLPTAVRRKILEYVGEKLSGRYGHSETQLLRFTCKLAITSALRFDLNPPRFDNCNRYLAEELAKIPDDAADSRSFKPATIPFSADQPDGVNYTIRTGIERDHWTVVVHFPGETIEKAVSGPREKAEKEALAMIRKWWERARRQAADHAVGNERLSSECTNSVKERFG